MQNLHVKSSTHKYKTASPESNSAHPLSRFLCKNLTLTLILLKHSKMNLLSYVPPLDIRSLLLSRALMLSILAGGGMTPSTFQQGMHKFLIKIRTHCRKRQILVPNNGAWDMCTAKSTRRLEYPHSLSLVLLPVKKNSPNEENNSHPLPSSVKALLLDLPWDTYSHSISAGANPQALRSRHTRTRASRTCHSMQCRPSCPQFFKGRRDWRSDQETGTFTSLTWLEANCPLNSGLQNPEASHAVAFSHPRHKDGRVSAGDKVC